MLKIVRHNAKLNAMILTSNVQTVDRCRFLALVEKVSTFKSRENKVSVPVSVFCFGLAVQVSTFQKLCPSLNYAILAIFVLFQPNVKKVRVARRRSDENYRIVLYMTASAWFLKQSFLRVSLRALSTPCKLSICFQQGKLFNNLETIVAMQSMPKIARKVEQFYSLTITGGVN